MTDDLAAWLLEQVQADEAVINAAVKRTSRWNRLNVPWLQVRRIQPELRKPDEALLAIWDPDRLLAECDAKRRMVELHTGGHECSVYDQRGEVNSCRYVQDFESCSTLLLLALPFATKPGYREEWRDLQLSW